ncbi:hypothetical protein [Glutamicibacter arilaitensis]
MRKAMDKLTMYAARTVFFGGIFAIIVLIPQVISAFAGAPIYY